MKLDTSHTALAGRKPGSGGKRSGAGRPKGSTHIKPEMRRIRVSHRLPMYMVELLEQNPTPMGRVIELALEKSLPVIFNRRKENAMQNLNDMLSTHVNLLQHLRKVATNQELYIKTLKINNEKLTMKIRMLQKGFADISEAIPEIAD